jgi:hypothetical protein
LRPVFGEGCATGEIADGVWPMLFAEIDRSRENATELTPRLDRIGKRNVDGNRSTAYLSALARRGELGRRQRTDIDVNS